MYYCVIEVNQNIVHTTSHVNTPNVFVTNGNGSAQQFASKTLTIVLNGTDLIMVMNFCQNGRITPEKISANFLDDLALISTNN